MPTMNTTQTKKITINNMIIHYADAGEGDVILFLHGWGANIDLIEPLAERLRRLSYRTISLDLPGFGQSDEPKQTWTVFDYAQFVFAFSKTIGLTQYHLFGHSFGGRLSLIIGADYPDQLGKIVLSNSAGIVEKAPIGQRIRLKIYQTIRDGLYRLGADTYADALRQAYTKRYGSSDFKQVSGVMRSTFVQVIQQDLQDYARRIQAPTLIFWGDKDEETPLSYGKRFEQLIPDAGLVVLEGAGHYSYLDHAARVAQVMHYFFQNDAK